MNISNLSIKELNELKDKLKNKPGSEKNISIIENAIYKKELKIFEDGDGAGSAVCADGGNGYSGGVAYTNASNVSGAGAIVAPQASDLPGATIGSNWSDHGGTIGSGDVSNPINKKRPYQKMGQNHGAGTGKKNRVKQMDIEALKKNTGKKSGNIMNFDDFEKSKMNKVTKLKN